MITMLRCQKCGSGYEYAGPALKSNPLIKCAYCDKVTRASVMLLLHRGDAQFTPLKAEQRPPPVVPRIQQTAKSHLDILGGREGVPHFFIPMPEVSEDEKAEFCLLFQNYVKSGDPGNCWPWKGTKDRDNHGRFYFRGKIYEASRIAYWLATGVDPKQRRVKRSCKNQSCCNPDHLSMSYELPP